MSVERDAKGQTDKVRDNVRVGRYAIYVDEDLFGTATARRLRQQGVAMGVEAVLMQESPPTPLSVVQMAK